MSAVQSVLIVGAGIAGSAAAIRLAEAGVSVEIAEIKTEVNRQGAGITLQGNALRALRDLGVWADVKEHGYAFDSLGIRAPDPVGTLVAEIPDARTGGPDLPAAMGMQRPDLTRILLDRATAVGAKLHLGTTVTDLQPASDGVDVLMSDGRALKVDLVIGADGVRSWTRRTLGIPLETRPTGMGIWRIAGPRPDSITRTELVYGGRCYIAGYCPTGPDTMYGYLVEDAQDRSTLSPAEQIEIVRDLAASYHGPWEDILPMIGPESDVNYSWFESHVLPPPWNRGRVVLIGDAAHACPPTLAQGGAQALEDAAVLTELLLERDVVDDALWQELMDRRYDRANAVVEASVQLADWLLAHERDADVPGLMGRIAGLVGVRP